MEQKKSALILGANGGIGGAIAAALLRHGWQVKGFARSTPKAQAGEASAMEWITGDAMNRHDVVAAASGVSVIVHAVNPPGYRNWETVVLPMLDNTIAAARAADGARVVLPGTSYNFDPATTPVVGGDTPQTAKSRKGAIRVEMEKRLSDAAPDVPSLVLRAGDFFGPASRSSWFSQAMVTPGKPVKRILNTARSAGHSWAYMPDLAEAFARVLDIEHRLAPAERLQFEGHIDDTGTRFTDAIRRVTGQNQHEWRFPWWLFQALAPFGGFPREAAEVVPHWSHPMRFDNSRLESLIGPEPHTQLDTAITAALVELGCLDAAPPARLQNAAA